MKNVLIINGHQRYEGIAEGNLSKLFVKEANDFLEEKGFKIKHTITDENYDIKEELEKFAWADYILLQFPVYWMGTPWITKKYIDDIFSAGHGTVTYEHDGRTRENPNALYGTGGLLKEKKYMLSLTYNAPEIEFEDKERFFEGMTLDEVNVATHKTFKYCGAKALKSYALYNVYKSELNIDNIKEDFIKVLKTNFN